MAYPKPSPTTGVLLCKKNKNKTSEPLLPALLSASSKLLKPHRRLFARHVVVTWRGATERSHARAAPTIIGQLPQPPAASARHCRLPQPRPCRAWSEPGGTWLSGSLSGVRRPVWQCLSLSPSPCWSTEAKVLQNAEAFPPQISNPNC
jgi:hypothetical protein